MSLEQPDAYAQLQAALAASQAQALLLQQLQQQVAFLQQQLAINGPIAGGPLIGLDAPPVGVPPGGPVGGSPAAPSVESSAPPVGIPLASGASLPVGVPTESLGGGPSAPPVVDGVPHAPSGVGEVSLNPSVVDEVPTAPSVVDALVVVGASGIESVELCGTSSSLEKLTEEASAPDHPSAKQPANTCFQSSIKPNKTNINQLQNQKSRHTKWTIEEDEILTKMVSRTSICNFSLLRR